MRHFLQRVLYGDPSEQIELNLWATMEDLERQLLEAEATGGQFMPAARQAREMLRAVGRR
jgi:hypothetical protein